MTKAATLALNEGASVELASAPREPRFALMPAMLEEINARGEITWVSDMWLEKLGYARAEVVGHLSTEFLTSESRERVTESGFPDLSRSGRHEGVELRLQCKDGRAIDVFLAIVVAPAEAEREASYLVSIADVTERRAAKRRLAESEARYRSLVEDQSEFVSLASPHGELLFVNHAYARLYGTVPEIMVGRSLFDFVPDSQRGSVEEHLKLVLASQDTVTDENQVMLPHGEARWISWSNRALADGAGRVTAIHSVGRDVDRRVISELRLKESEARYRMLADHSTDMVFQLDLGFTRRYVSPASRDVLGYAPEELVGVKPVSMVHPDDAARVAQVFKSLTDGRVDRQVVVNRIRHGDGHYVWVESQLRALKDPVSGAATGIIGALRDISARKSVEDQLAEANRRLEALARRDALTGLANRREFDDVFTREHRRFRRRKKGLALLMIDVDWFKPFNDTYGHQAGDECLRRISGTIAGAISRAGDVAARYGGEEFVVLLPDTDEAGAALIGERVREAVRRAAILHEASPKGVATVSVGAAAIDSESADVASESLLRLADRALYLAKQSGRDNVVCASRLPAKPAAA
jgi:diguanylate cyclase (GGDEF)-like protein/PAS domain S-box-containing protein